MVNAEALSEAVVTMLENAMIHRDWDEVSDVLTLTYMLNEQIQGIRSNE